MLAGFLQPFHCREMAEHGQGAADLLEGRFQRGHAEAFGRIAEKHIQALLDMGQVVLDFASNLADQQFFLCSPGDFIE